jgi:cytochrome c oxidase cbb3-type subunit 1
MAPDSFLTPQLKSEGPNTPTSEASVIDASLRTPLTVLITSALLWLLVASALGVVAAWQLHTPSFLNNCEFVTYGRIQPAQSSVFIYGWGFNAAFAVSLWLMARLSRGVLPGFGTLLLGTVFWNVGVAVGLIGILSGFSSAIAGLDMPGFALPLLWIAYALIAAWSFVVFRAGRSQQLFSSQWYLFVALLAFPWIYSIAQVMLVLVPVRGTVQSVIQAWFSGNLLLLWFTSIGLAAIYYFLPKLLLKPVANYNLASLAFWWFLVFGSWSGLARLLGGPVPAWVQTFGAAASFMLVVPLVIYWLNFFGTLAGSWASLKDNPSLRFIAFSVVSLLLLLLTMVADATHGFAALTQFTYFTTAEVQLGLYGFFTMVIFGSLYAMVPRLFATPWASEALTGVHFVASAFGVILLVVSLAIGGIQQGLKLEDPSISFSAVTSSTLPYLFSASVGCVLLAIGQLAFAINFFWTLANASAGCVRSVKDLLAGQPEATR